MLKHVKTSSFNVFFLGYLMRHCFAVKSDPMSSNDLYPLVIWYSFCDQQKSTIKGKLNELNGSFYQMGGFLKINCYPQVSCSFRTMDDVPWIFFTILPGFRESPMAEDSPGLVAPHDDEARTWGVDQHRGQPEIQRVLGVRIPKWPLGSAPMDGWFMSGSIKIPI